MLAVLRLLIFLHAHACTVHACREGGSWVLSGRKWWASGAMDPRCKIAIFMGKSSPSAAKHKQQSMVLVPLDTPGVRIIRPMTVYGYDDAPHGHAEVVFEVGLCSRGLDCFFSLIIQLAKHGSCIILDAAAGLVADYSSLCKHIS